MAFLPERYEDGRLETVPLVTSATVAKGDALADAGTGLLQRATSSDNLVPYVAMEAVTSAAAGATILAIPTRDIDFVADTNASPVATDRYTMADLTDHDTLNESASTVDVFFIKNIKGAAADKKVIGYFVGPEATTS